MTVKDLIKKLNKCDPEATIIIHDFEWGYFEISAIEKKESVMVNRGFFESETEEKNVVILK